MHSPVICILYYVPVIILIILHVLYNSVKIIITILGGVAINITSTAYQNELSPGEFITFHCVASGSRLVWTLDNKSEFSFDNLQSDENIVHKPQKDSHATLLPHRDGLWESTYTLLSLPSSGNMTVACFNGSASEELIVSVIAGMYVCW